MILQSLGIEYEILEGSDRPGGRILTHHFEKGKAPWNYFDIGAMRYPKIEIMWRVFNLFEDRLGLKDKLVPYIMSCENQFLEFNRQKVQQKEADKEADKKPRADVFKDSVENKGLVPKLYTDAGVSHWLEECFNPFKTLLAQDWNKGWDKLMKYDKYSARSFMATAFHDKKEDGTDFLKKDAYPDAVINWLERMNTGTGLFDMAFAEMVIDDLQFDWPNASSVKYGATPADGQGPSWYCLAGGSEVFIKAMVSKLTKKIQYKKRVTHIFPTGEAKPMQLKYSYGKEAKGEANFNYVISTIPLPSLRFVDLDMCNLSYAQLEGMRTLRYDSSCKVGIRFKSRWWQTLRSGSIKGGQSKTDRIIRTAVFPSYGVNDPDADAVMIASYTWSQDASRVGGLMRGRDSEAEAFLIENILEDLSLLHGVDLKFLRGELDDWCAFDWYADPHTLGAFALFGPGQFSNIYPAFGQGAAGGRLLFAGEALSAQHAWVEGALDSAYAAVQRLLDGAGLRDKLKELEAKWGNPHVREEERKESKDIMWLQEIIGAVLSIMTDYNDIKGAFKDLELESMFEKFVGELEAVSAAA